MKKEVKYLDLGEQFKVVNNIMDGYSGNYKTLYECYGRPSCRKVVIYERYKDMLQKHCDDLLCYGVRSYNCMKITLEAIVKKDGQKYYLKITPSYNYAQEIDE